MIQLKKRFITDRSSRSSWQIKFCKTHLSKNCSRDQQCMNSLNFLRNQLIAIKKNKRCFNYEENHNLFQSLKKKSNRVAKANSRSNKIKIMTLINLTLKMGKSTMMAIWRILNLRRCTKSAKGTLREMKSCSNILRRPKKSSNKWIKTSKKRKQTWKQI